MGKRNGARKGARRSGNPARREAERLYSGNVLGERMYAAAAPRAGVQPGAVIPVGVPGLPDSIVIRGAAESDAALLEPVIRMADPDNADGSWLQLPAAISQSLDPDKYTHVRVAEETSSGALVGGALALPAPWALTHPMLVGSPNAHIAAGLVADLDSLAVVEEWRGKGIARALVAEAEKAMGTHEEGKFGAAVMYVTHEPELTDFYAGLGFTLSPDGIGIPTPAGFICHGPTKDYRISVKPLRTGVQMQPMPTPYGRQLVIHGVLPLPST
ncbi:GNAT family N-acetyltransferase [Streptomyces sp. HC44]|uniref:GNAT family N-acetyltransferase n=1 Tax=Streptomyces scabichelini TaxID=2711217 RepID=A0A6G4VH73_9ACTN|nr:GNAT family N-acetyltransferase [Streptomyces scabichelini]NGO13137.1 GNAT family N-acetyltransferase [Streptomyces scabichelini]